MNRNVTNLLDGMLRCACDYCGRADPPKDGRCEGCGAPRKPTPVPLPDRDIMRGKPPIVPLVPMTR